MIKDGITRKILFSDLFEFIAPDFIMSEVEKYKQLIMDRAEINKSEFEYLILIIFERIKVLSKENYSNFLEESRSLIDDKKDAPYIAVYFFSKSEGIWTHDNHFSKLKNVNVFSNIDLLELIQS